MIQASFAVIPWGSIGNESLEVESKSSFESMMSSPETSPCLFAHCTTDSIQIKSVYMQTRVESRLVSKNKA